MIKKFQFPPGINRESTQFGASGSWYKCNNMRFRGGVPETIGGWSRLESYELEGFGRACHSTKSFEGYRYRWVGTNEKFYVITSNGAVDITPNRAVKDPLGSNPMTLGTDKVLTVTDNTADVQIGDWVLAVRRARSPAPLLSFLVVLYSCRRFVSFGGGFGARSKEMQRFIDCLWRDFSSSWDH